MATEYIVFEGDSGKWELVGKAIATSNKAAITAVLEGIGDEAQGGEFVAVPARSWQPIKVEIKTALKFN